MRETISVGWLELWVEIAGSWTQEGPSAVPTPGPRDFVGHHLAPGEVRQN